MKKIVLVFAVAFCLLAAAPTAHAQYPTWSYNYNVYPGGGSYDYSVSNGYATVNVYQRFGYGSAHHSWYRYQNYPYPAYYPVSPAYQYQYSYNMYRWHYHHHHRR